VRGALVSVSVLLIGLVLVGQAVARSSARSSSGGRATVARYESGTVLVGFRAGVTPVRRRLLERSVRARSSRPLGYIGSATPPARALERRLGSSFELRVSRGTVLQAVRRLEAQRRWVRYAEPNYLMQASPGSGHPLGRPNALSPPDATPAQCAPGPTTATPNDPCFGLLWGDLNTGQTISGSDGTITGTAGADDHVADAWNVTKGSRSIVIGEVDSGVDATHPDLQANIWSDPSGILGCPAGTYGFTTINNTTTCGAPDTDPAPPTSYGGHGTHVAGMMGALGNNGKGVVGVNWQTTILPVQWLSSVGGGGTGGSVGDLINALGLLVQAKQAGVKIRVVNDSPVFTNNPNYDDPALESQLQALGAHNILFVTAAGGALSPTGSGYWGSSASNNYPCAYSLSVSNVICVTGTDQNDKLAFWADHGTDVQLAAPADNIYSTLENNGYGYISGGSMAAAQVSGAAALILSAHPSMSMGALKADILGNVQPLSSLTADVTTGGILDVCAAMPGCASKTSTAVTCPPGSVTNGQGVACTAVVTDAAGGATVTPAGHVAFTTDSPGTFKPKSCLLSPSSTPGSATCRTTYTPSKVGTGTHHITATYGVSVAPASSSGSTALTVNPS
jgi:subtilisin family serine protease